MIDPLARLEGVRRLIDRRAYFAIHAPRQVGKTTSLEALAVRLRAEGSYAAAHLSCQVGRAFPNSPGEAEDAMLSVWRRVAELSLPVVQQPPEWEARPAGSRIFHALSRWAKACPLPLVLFLDEVDALSGPTLLSLLSQLREGHTQRPLNFPHSVALIGMRDVRDYRAVEGGTVLSSPFNAGSGEPAVGPDEIERISWDRAA